MSAPVDVLAVMEADAALAREARMAMPMRVMSLGEIADCTGRSAAAGAAVAELVAKVRAYEAVSGKAGTFGEVRDARRGMFAALAKFQEVPRV